MEILSLVLSLISTIAAVISAIIAVGAKAEVKKLKHNIKGNRNNQSFGKISIKNEGNNKGVMSAINSGDIHV